MKRFFGILILSFLAIGLISAQGNQIGNNNSGYFVWVANGLDNNLSVINSNTGKVIATLPTGTNPHILSISPDGKLVYVINSGEHDREPADHSDGSKKEMGSDKMGNSMAENGMESSSNDKLNINSLWVFNTTTGNVIAKIPVGKGPTHPIPSNDGKTAYIALSKENAVAVIAIPSGKILNKIDVGKKPEQIDLSKDGRILYSSNNGDNTVTVVDLVKQRVLSTINVGHGAYGIQAVDVNLQKKDAFPATIPKNSNGYRQISADQLEKMLVNKTFKLINVHVPLKGDIPGTDANIAFNRMDEIKTKYPEKNTVIVLYCRSGSMSRFASMDLAASGYTDIIELNGGYNSWKSSGYNMIITK